MENTYPKVKFVQFSLRKAGRFCWSRDKKRPSSHLEGEIHMNEMIALQQKIAPELIEVVERRYTILRTIALIQPVGRRMLAGRLKLSERQVRGEIDFLKSQGLIEGDNIGMTVSPQGEELLSQLADFVKRLIGMTEAEEDICRSLGLKRVIIVPGNSDQDDSVKRELGRAASRYIRELLRSDSILAVTGGSTLREVAATMPKWHGTSDIVVVPARGGLGENVEMQANTIAASIAKKLKGSYRLLHVPDNITKEAMRLLLEDPHIKELVQEIKAAQILVHGIGDARELSENRGDSPDQTEELVNKGAVGEAFGHYFGKDGTIVKSIHSLGLRLQDLSKIPTVMCVGGGEKKAAAILAVCRNKQEDVLITDQGAAKVIINLLGR